MEHPARWFSAALLGLALVCNSVAGAEPSPMPTAPYAKWSHGPSSDAAFFPLAVWLQDPVNAERYRQAGINTYVALWRGPTEAQLAALKKAGMRLVCAQNQTALRHLDDPAIIAWMHGDEPDNAQSQGQGKGWGPPVAPEKIVADYRRIQAADPSRPILLNLGQGVAWDGWYGRGSRSNHPEDYPKYLEGCDVVSFDIYPAVHEHPDVAGKLWLVAYGVERLVQWSDGKRLVWNCLECTHISNPDRKPTPQEVRCEAWMSLIHGSRGLIYFVHEFKPGFREAALLDDAPMLEGVTALNHQIARLAPVLNSPTLADAARVESAEATAPVAVLVKSYDGKVYLFAVAMRGAVTSATFTLKGLEGDQTVEVIDEHRTLPSHNGVFGDHFAPWEVHLYRVAVAH